MTGKIWFKAGILTSVVLIALVSAGAALAQGPYGNGPGGGSGPGGNGRGMGTGPGPYAGGWMMVYEDEIHEAIADAIGITEEEFDASIGQGMTMQEIALANGADPDAVWDAAQEAREAAATQAVEDGLITQEQADWVLSRMGGYGGNGPGCGSGSCAGQGTGPADGSGFQMRRGRNW